MRKRPIQLVAVLLAMLMCLTLLPVTATAEIAELPARVITALQSSEGLKTLFTAAEPEEKPSVQTGAEDSSVDNTTTSSRPQLTSFTIPGNNDGAQANTVYAGMKLATATPYTVTNIEIKPYETEQPHYSAGGVVGNAVNVGEVVLTIKEDYLTAAPTALRLFGGSWTATASEGTVIDNTYAIVIYKENDYVNSDLLYISVTKDNGSEFRYYYLVKVAHETAPSWPQLETFTTNQVKFLPVKAEGLTEKFVPVSKIEIMHNKSLIGENGKNIAGTVIIYVGEDFSVRKAVQVVKDTWQVTVSDGVTLVTATSKPITAQSKTNYIAAAALQLSDGTDSVYYNVKFESTVDSTPPKLSTIIPVRSSHTDASITFTSNEVGTYYYTVVNADAEAPTVDTTGEGTAMTAGENTITLTNLTEGAKKLYLMAKDESGNISEALVIDIPAYIEPTYKMTIPFMPSEFTAGWSLLRVTADGVDMPINAVGFGGEVTGIKANQTVQVWMNVPDTTKRLSEVKMVSDDADKADVKTTIKSYNSFTFTMPEKNVRPGSGNWFTLTDAGVPRYSLSATVTKLWEHLEYQETNLKGYVNFVDANGTPITQAVEGETVKAMATPRNTADYEFAFVQWKNENGITIANADREKDVITFSMPGNAVSLFAEFKNVGTTVTWGSDPTDAPKVTVNGNTLDTTYVYRTGSTAEVGLIGGNDWRKGWIFVGWEIKVKGVDRSKDESIVTYRTEGDFSYPQVKLTGDPVEITAKFQQKAFAVVSAKPNDPAMGSATVAVDGGASATSQVVFQDQTVTLTATPGDRYTLKGWEVKEDGSDTLIPTTPVEDNANQATFTMPATNKPITATAIFAVDPAKASKEKVLKIVALYQSDGTTLVASGNKQKTAFTITLPANTDTSDLANMILKLTVSEHATVKKSGDTDNWPAAGKACGMELNKATTFTVTAENGDAQDYTVTITKAKSSEKNITAAVLLDQTGDITPLAVGTVSEDKIIFTLPSNTDKAVLNSIGMKYLKLTYPETATAKMVNSDGQDAYGDTTGSSKWRNGDVMCNMSLNTPAKFIITAENGSTKTYTVTIKYTAPNAPTLSNGSATRTSKAGATVKFTSSEAGNYFYKVVDHGAAAPTVDTSKNGTSAVKGENTITLSNLTEDARDIYIVVVNASGGKSAALKVEIPAYGSGSETPDTGKFTISVNAPKGGTITPNRTKANAGDEIIVTVTPDSGYQMVADSLTYTLAVEGGKTVKITNNRFTMPEGNVSISCQWETAATTAKGITAFSINGVAGAVNNTTNTITITMPRGTDVTKLAPVIATNGVKSLTPSSGETVNFTNSVTYTANMDDGSVKTYTVTVYVDKGTLADQFWDKLTDFVNQVPWWEYAKHQQSSSKYPKYW